MELEDNVITVELTKSGKPRKRKPKTSHTYFTEDTQNAIVEYVASQDQKFRDKVYRERIEYGFFKLTQNIILQNVLNVLICMIIILIKILN